MIIISTLFAVVFAIMIYSMVKHRKSQGHQPAKFTGPTGTVQWLWALVPFAILIFIDYILVGIPAYHAVVQMEDTKTKADMVLKVTGMQWKWQYEYPDSGIKFISTLATPRDQIANKETKGEHYLLDVDNLGGFAGRQEGTNSDYLDRRHPHLVGAAVWRKTRCDPRLPA